MTIDTDCSHVQFLYPIQFDARSFDRRVKVIEEAHWPSRDGSFSIWERDQFPADDLLSHVADYLNPRNRREPPEKNQIEVPETAMLWKLSDQALTSMHGLGGGMSRARIQWTLITSKRTIDFNIASLQFCLFRVGVGFLVIDVHVPSNSWEDWFDLLHYFRFVRGQRRVHVRAHTQTAPTPGTHERIAKPAFPEPAGGLVKHPDGEGLFGDVLDALTGTGTVPDESSGSWWADILMPAQCLPFASLFLDGIPEPEIMQVVYRGRNFFHSAQELYPSDEDLRPNHPLLLSYAKNQWFSFSLDGGSFLAFDAPKTPFFRNTLPDHLRTQYFLLYLIVLHQRCALTKLSGEVARHWLVGNDPHGIEGREEAFVRIRDSLLSFTARGFFTQVMQREHHHRCYRKWQEVLQVDRLYQEVSDEVHQMHDCVQAARTERLKEQAEHLERRISRLGLLVGVPAVILSYLGINLQGVTSEFGLPWWLALALGLGGGLLLGYVILRLISAREKGKSTTAP